jgi:hypothetical protein
MFVMVFALPMLGAGDTDAIVPQIGIVFGSNAVCVFAEHEVHAQNASDIRAVSASPRFAEFCNIASLFR